MKPRTSKRPTIIVWNGEMEQKTDESSKLASLEELNKFPDSNDDIKNLLKQRTMKIDHVWKRSKSMTSNPLRSGVTDKGKMFGHRRSRSDLSFRENLKLATMILEG